jgi:hypothetical protein
MSKRIEFAKIIRLAKEQTGKHRPSTEEIIKQLHEGGAYKLIHQTALNVLTNDKDPIADDNYAHYAVEEVIGLACVEYLEDKRTA